MTPIDHGTPLNPLSNSSPQSPQFPSPGHNRSGEENFLSPTATQDAINFATSARELQQLLSSLPSTIWPHTSPEDLYCPGIACQIVTGVANCLQAFQTFADSNPTANFPSMMGYEGFFGFMVGGQDSAGHTLTQPVYPNPGGKPLFAWNGSSITSPAGLYLNATSIAEQTTNVNILTAVWNDAPGNDYPSPGFLTFAQDLAYGAPSTAAQCEEYCPSTYLPGPSPTNGITVPSGPPANWPVTTPPTTWSPFPYGGDDPGHPGGTVASYLEAESAGTPPLYTYHPIFFQNPPDTTTYPNLAYWMNMGVLCMKALSDYGSTPSIPLPSNFSTTLLATMTALTNIASDASPTTYTLDPATAAFFSLFNCASPSLVNSQGPSTLIYMVKQAAADQNNPTALANDMTGIQLYLLGWNSGHDGDPFSPFCSNDTGTSPAGLLLQQLDEAYGVLGDDDWIHGALNLS